MAKSYGFKVKTGNNSFGEEIKFATTTDLVKDKNTNETLETILTKDKNIAAKPYFSDGTEKFIIPKGGNIYPVPLGKNQRELSQRGRAEVIGEKNWNENLFSFTPRGGIRFEQDGVVLVSGSIYADAAGQNAQIGRVGCYLHLLVDIGQREQITAEDLENETFASDVTNITQALNTPNLLSELKEIISSYPYHPGGVISSGSRIISVKKGDIIYLSGRVSEDVGINLPISIVSNQTCLNIVYLT